MKCPFCANNNTSVKDSRASEDNSVIRRRRICSKCNSRFTTFERIKLTEMMVVKKNSHTETFSRDKLMKSILLAVRKRPIPPSQIEELTNNIIQKIENIKDNKVTTTFIGKTVMENLLEVDAVAYIRFASVYMSFDKMHDFNSIIEKISGNQ